jgi:hypothetical protein
MKVVQREMTFPQIWEDFPVFLVEIRYTYQWEGRLLSGCLLAGNEGAMIMDAILLILPVLTSAVLVCNFVTCIHRHRTVEDVYRSYHHLGPLCLPVGHQPWSVCLQYRCPADAGSTLDVLPGHVY